MMRCDVVIPTYNNAGVIAQTLTQLGQQTIPAGWEVGVLLSDDGSTDATRAIIQAQQLPRPWSMRLLCNTHQGGAAARNTAIAEATGDIIFLLGADIWLRPGALAAHLQFHTAHPNVADAAVGFVTWDPALPPSPFMEWLIHGGPQNDFDGLLGQITAEPAHALYGSHASVKRTLLQQEKFSVAFTAYGWEDLELGRRLQARGMRLYPLIAARGLHHHAYTVTTVAGRQFAAGRGLVRYQALHPHTTLLPVRPWWHRHVAMLATWIGAGRALMWLVSKIEERWSMPRLYQAVGSLYFWQGVYAENKNLNRANKI